jgi:hypothetical protein
LIDSNTAKLGLVSMLDTSSNFLTLAFTNNTGGIFTNAEGVTGPFTLAGLGLVVPSSLNGLTMHGEDTAFYGFTNVFGDGTLVSTEPGGSSTGTFAFMPCSPASGLLIETFSNVVDYALLSFGVTSNTYETISVVGGNITASDSGAFTLSGEAATRGYKAPLSIAHLLGTVTIVKTDGTRRASVISFDPGSFGQFSASTNNNSDGEVYSYVRTGTNTAIFVMGSGNNSDSNEFYFVGPRTATFTNSDSRGVVTFTAAPNFVPLSVVGKKLRATPAGGPPTIVTLGYGTFTGSESTNVVTGSYTFAPYGSNVATTQVSYTDSKNAGETDSIVFWFSSPIAGRYEDTDNSGRVTIGTFTLE